MSGQPRFHLEVEHILGSPRGYPLALHLDDGLLLDHGHPLEHLGQLLLHSILAALDLRTFVAHVTVRLSPLMLVARRCRQLPPQPRLSGLVAGQYYVHRRSSYDEATVCAYGWGDLLNHGFHPGARETRCTLGRTAVIE